MNFDSLDAIRAHSFVGCHAADADAFSAIGDFAGDWTRPVADRAEALRIMQDSGMGCGRSDDISDIDFLDAYFA